MLIRSLRAFLALHRCGTVVGAAEKVHLSQAAVSVQLKNMESELGVALFVRTKRSLDFTPAGHMLVPLAEQMVSIYEEMKALKAGRPVGGVLSLGVINSALGGVLPELLRDMTQRNPGLEVKVVAGISGELVAQVDRGTLDMAIVTQPPKRFPTNLAVHHLYSEPFALLTPAEEPCDDIVRALHSSRPYIAFDRGTWAGQLIDEYRLKRGVMTRPGMELNSLDAIAGLVRRGLGTSIVPLIRGASWHESPDLHVVRLPNFERPVSLVSRVADQRDTLRVALLACFETAQGLGMGDGAETHVPAATGTGIYEHFGDPH
ncbi:LysR family transcriptional regulator [Pseudorhodoferax soli]|uniref:DNA-binding transcriptional LysR family regulator n=1 Tax=Pseudorhodoferax soli TaxID=545864 RepID=A0A368XKL5_9BURK|nr:LysR family transcriptional regulator [Pseudorhodoferax soli]RCW68571.1 DNA-binding transcriptional LysR family regulator [Pseudorhodoferax soli]